MNWARFLKLPPTVYLFILVGIAVRLYYLAQPMRYDESYTFMEYVASGLSGLLVYEMPNNHVFHSILVYASTSLFGDSPAAIRMPAFVAGVMCIPLVYCVCVSMLGHGYGYVAAAIMAIHPYTVLYSTNARGYSIIMCIFLIMILCANEYIRHPSRRLCIDIGLLGSIGMLTIPVMLFPLVGLYIWVIVSLIAGTAGIQVSIKNIRQFLLWGVGTTAIGTIILYVPVIMMTGSVEAIVDNSFVTALDNEQFLNSIVPLLNSAIIEYTFGAPILFTVVILILCLIGLGFAIIRREHVLTSFVVALITGGIVVVVAKRHVPFARVWIYMAPVACMLADYGYMVSVEKCRKSLKRIWYAVCVVYVVVFAFALTASNVIVEYPSGASCIEAEYIVRYLKESVGSRLAFDALCPVDAIVAYYARKCGVHYDESVSPERYYIVVDGFYRISDMTPANVKMIARIGKAAIYRQ